MKWEKTMTSLGLTPANFSKSVKKKVDKYNDLAESLADARQDLKDAGDDETKKKKFANQVATLEDGLLKLDEVLAKDMNRLHTKKDHYAKLTGNLKFKGKEEVIKKMAGGTTAATTAAPAEQAPPKKPAAATPPKPAEQAPPAEKPKPATPANPKQPTPPAKTEKKKNNNGVIVTAVVIGLFTLGIGGFIWWKKRNS